MISIDIKILRDVILNTVKKHPTKQFLGTKLASHGNKYQYKTFLETFEIAKFIGSGILNSGLAFETEKCEITGF